METLESHCEEILILLMCPSIFLSYRLFFINNSLIPQVVNSEYLPILISDHAPLSLDILLFPFHTFRPPWRFNSLILSDLAFCEYISNSIDDFLLTNQTDSISYSLLWESLKAFLRGQIISYSAYVNLSYD